MVDDARDVKGSGRCLIRRTYRPLPLGSEENHEKRRSGYSVSQLVLKPDISRIRSEIGLSEHVEPYLDAACKYVFLSQCRARWLKW